MDDFLDELYPELTLETDDIIMKLAIKKDYSQIEDLDKRKKEFINQNIYNCLFKFILIL